MWDSRNFVHELAFPSWHDHCATESTITLTYTSMYITLTSQSAISDSNQHSDEIGRDAFVFLKSVATTTRRLT